MGFMEDGEDLMDAVSDAILHNDYSRLNDAIHDTVNDVTDTIGNVTSAIGDNFARYGRDDRYRRDDRYKGNGPDQGPNRPGSEPHRSSSGQYAYRYGRGSAASDEKKQLPRTAFNSGKRLSGTGLVQIIVGSCLIFFFGFPCLLAGILLIVEEFVIAVPSLIIGALITIPSAWLISTGNKKRALQRRFSQYKKLAGNEEFLDIGKLARQTGQTKAKTLEDLRQMMDAGWLPGSWIDPAGTTLILTEEAYQQYQKAQESFQERQKKSRKKTAGKTGTKKSAYTKEVQKIVADGEKYRDEIHHANDVIPDETMSEKLAQLETLLDRIFSQVKKKPEAAKELHSLMNYYLPTTMKLVNAYIELDAQPDAGENIRKTKKEIEDALDTINAAFEKLLDSLFEDMAWDIESDIDVMKTMFQRDGLTQDDLQKAQNQEAQNQEKEQEEDQDEERETEKKTWSQMKEEAGVKEKEEEISRRD